MWKQQWKWEEVNGRNRRQYTSTASAKSSAADRGTKWSEKHKHRKMRGLLTDIESETSETKPSAKVKR